MRSAMKLQSFASRLAASSLLALGVWVNSAIAGAPGTCGPTSVCAPTCGSPGDSGAPCFVRISHDSTKLATATVENLAGGAGSPNADICVSAGTVILWFTLEEKSQFTIDFGAAHPF